MLDTTAATNAILENGGITISLEGTEPTTGFAVGAYPDRSWVLPTFSFDDVVLAHWVSVNIEWLGRSNHYVGAWVSDGLVHLDVTRVIEDRTEAIELGQRKCQLCIWDIKRAEEVAVS
jgi:hypothetical protein